jgi:hypothetical protein
MLIKEETFDAKNVSKYIFQIYSLKYILYYNISYLSTNTHILIQRGIILIYLPNITLQYNT